MTFPKSGTIPVKSAQTLRSLFALTAGGFVYKRFKIYVFHANNNNSSYVQVYQKCVY